MSTEQKIDTAMIPDERVCIVPVGYDIDVDGDPGCPIIEDANLPNPITANGRYALTNPFGNVFVYAQAQVQTSGVWSDTGQAYNNGSYGTRANARGATILVATGTVSPCPAYTTGLGGNTNGSDIASLPARIYVTRGKQ